MRLQILSDLHIDVNGGGEIAIAESVDLLVVAGDICEGADRGFAFLRERVPASLPIATVLGNHEFYHRDLGKERRMALAAAKRFAITLLDDGTATFGDVRLIGSTLWTDYDIFGVEQRETCMRAAEASLNDHHLIDFGIGFFSASDARQQHLQSRVVLERWMSESFSGPTIVVTHHAPHPNSIAARYRTSPVTGAFVSDLEPLIVRHAPALWVHGHTHTSFDYRVGETRIICNPKGYGDENPEFAEALIVDF